MTMATTDKAVLGEAPASTTTKDYSRLDVNAILKGMEDLGGELEEESPSQDKGILQLGTVKLAETHNEQVTHNLREIMGVPAPPDLNKAMEKMSVRGGSSSHHESVVDKLYEKAAQRHQSVNGKKLRNIKSADEAAAAARRPRSKSPRRQTSLPSRGAGLRKTNSLSGLALKAAVGGMDALEEAEAKRKAKKSQDPLSKSLHGGGMKKPSSTGNLAALGIGKANRSTGSSSSRKGSSSRSMRKTASCNTEKEKSKARRSQSPRRSTVVGSSPPARGVRRSSSLGPSSVNGMKSHLARRESKDELRGASHHERKHHHRSSHKKSLRKTNSNDSKGTTQSDDGAKSKRPPRKTRSGDDGNNTKRSRSNAPEGSASRQGRKPVVRSISFGPGDNAKERSSPDTKAKALANKEIFEQSTNAVMSRMKKGRESRDERGRRSRRRDHNNNKSDDDEGGELVDIPKRSSDTRLTLKKTAPRDRSPRRATIQVRDYDTKSVDGGDDEEIMPPKRISDPSLISRVQRTRSPRRATMAARAMARGSSQRRLAQGVAIPSTTTEGSVDALEADTSGSEDGSPKRESVSDRRQRRRRNHQANNGLSSSSDHRISTDDDNDDDDAPRKRISTGRLRVPKNAAAASRDRRRSTSHSPMRAQRSRRTAENIRQLSLRRMLIDKDEDDEQDVSAPPVVDEGISKCVQSILGDTLAVPGPTTVPDDLLPPSVAAAFSKSKTQQSSRSSTSKKSGGRNSTASLKDRIKRSMEEKNEADVDEASVQSSSTRASEMTEGSRGSRKSTITIPYGKGQLPKDLTKNAKKERNSSFMSMPFQTGFSDLYDDESAHNLALT